MSAPVPTREELPRLLKTCQTCYKLKMKCTRTQESGSCNRCLRLGKKCVFSRAKKGLGSRRGLSPARNLRVRSDFVISSPSRSPQNPDSAPLRNYESRSSAPSDPFIREILPIDEGKRLLRVFTTKMAFHFPFVIIPPSMSLHQLQEERPVLALAIMGVASYDNICQQATLVKLFREMISTLILDGNFNTLGVLQALLVSVAWAQYQPKPNRHSAYLHLAISIIKDMRLDCRANMRPWQFFCKHSKQNPSRSSDELRALAGTYYLAASSSIILLKRQHFSYTSLIYESCQHLAQVSEYPTDRFLPIIIKVQQVMEQVDNIIHVVAVTASVGEINTHIYNTQHELDTLKMSTIASLHECPPLMMQMHMIDLLVSQILLPGFPFAVDKHQVQITSEQKLTECFSACTTAAKSLLSGLLMLPPGFEATLSNMEWIMVHCALSIAARLDVMTTDPRIEGTVRHMRLFLDFPCALMQIMHRIESVPCHGIDKETDGRHTFSELLDRAKAIESWYLEQTGRSSLLMPIPAPTTEASELADGNPADLQLTPTDGGSKYIQLGLDEGVVSSGEEIKHPSPRIGAVQRQAVITGLVGELSEFSVMDFLDFEDEGQGFGDFYGLTRY